MSEPDNSLLVEFNARRSEDAFAALVRQHVNLVFATAMRQVGDAGAAEEITQNVFVALAQAAGRLGSHPTIAGWLHQTALNKSREWLRSELRRRKREQAAVNLQIAREEGDSVWSPLVPLLDEALLELRDADRQAVILHFLEGRNFQEVGSALGVGEDAARKRVNRCLEQLTNFFRRQGFAVPALSAAVPLFALASHTAPAGLAASATTAGVSAAHSAASISILTLTQGALKIMAWTKAKTAIVASVGVLLAAGTTTVVVKHMIAEPARVSNGTVDDSFFEANDNKLLSAPPNLLILRASRSTRTSGPLTIAGYRGMAPGAFRMSGRGVSFDDVVNIAFGSLPTRIVYAADPPRGKFDLLVTVPEKQKEALQAEIARQYGLTARREMRTTDALVLKVKTPDVPGLRAEPTGKRGSQSGEISGRYVSKNMPIGHLAAYLEIKFRRPVLDETGLAGNYTYEFPGNVLDSPELLKEILLNQLGLELVPARKPAEMLVVEKTS